MLSTAPVPSVRVPPASSPSTATVGRIAAATSGGVAAAAALAAGEVAAALADSEPSPVTAVGSEFIDRFAARLKELAVSLFGTNDKTALVTGIVVSSLLLGGVLGLVARRRWIAAPVGFAAFGAVGGWAMATDPQGTVAGSVVAALAAVAAGVAAFALLWGLARPGVGAAPVVATPVHEMPTERPKDDDRPTIIGRRRFLAGAGGVLVVTAAGTAWSRYLRGTDTVNAARRQTVLPRPVRSVLPPDTQPFAIDGLTPYVTPTPDFYRIDTALSVPQVDAGSWRLAVRGMVDEPFELTYDDLLSMDSAEETVTIQCVSNEVGGNLIGNAVWQGVPLRTLLERAGIREGATQVVGRSVDGFTAGFPTSAALDGRTALVAYGMNGEPLPASHGYPARLVVAGLYGYVSATKWLEAIELARWEDVDGYWIPRGWAKEGPIKTASRIDLPRRSATLTAGPQAIAGVAWAPTRGIERVEVQVDDGEWREADLGRTASDDTWVQWHVAWDATPGDHVIRARATDGTGETQTSDESPPAPDGATGWPTRRVTVA